MEKMENNYPKKSLEVKLTLVNGKTVQGKMNIMGYKRMSDFIDDSTSNHIRLYDVKMPGATSTTSFILVPKTKVLFYEPEEKEE